MYLYMYIQFIHTIMKIQLTAGKYTILCQCCENIRDSKLYARPAPDAEEKKYAKICASIFEPGLGISSCHTFIPQTHTVNLHDCILHYLTCRVPVSIIELVCLHIKLPSTRLLYFPQKVNFPMGGGGGQSIVE